MKQQLPKKTPASKLVYRLYVRMPHLEKTKGELIKKLHIYTAQKTSRSSTMILDSFLIKINVAPSNHLKIRQVT